MISYRLQKQLWGIKIALMVVALWFIVSCTSETQEIGQWSFATGNRIQSSPLIDGNMVFVGSNDSAFYAVSAANGSLLWQRKTGHTIRSKAATDGNLVFFTSGNNLHALNKLTGEDVWIYNSSDSTGAQTLDPWDYHQSSPVMYNSLVFAGFGDGWMKGFDTKTGLVTFNFKSIESTPIRSTPVIQGNTIYFGDWNGRIYAVNIETGDTLWTHRTYDMQPYTTFGQINTVFVIHDTVLLYGARNPEIHALNTKTGKRIWSHIEKDGGWISGDPVVSGDTLFIGGSDCHKLFAFNVYSGELLYAFEFLFNNLSKPLVHGNVLMFTTGDAYAFNGDYYGNGYLYAIDKKDGSLVNVSHYDGNLFTEPALYKNLIITGGDNGNLQSENMYGFINPTREFPGKGLGPVTQMQSVYDSAANNHSLSLQMEYPATVELCIRSFAGKMVRVLYDGNLSKGVQNYTWDFKDTENDLVKEGYYFFEARSGIFFRNILVHFTKDK